MQENFTYFSSKHIHFSLSMKSLSWQTSKGPCPNCHKLFYILVLLQTSISEPVITRLDQFSMFLCFKRNKFDNEYALLALPCSLNMLGLTHCAFHDWTGSDSTNSINACMLYDSAVCIFNEYPEFERSYWFKLHSRNVSC